MQRSWVERPVSIRWNFGFGVGWIFCSLSEFRLARWTTSSVWIQSFIRTTHKTLFVIRIKLSILHFSFLFFLLMIAINNYLKLLYRYNLLTMTRNITFLFFNFTQDLYFFNAKAVLSLLRFLFFFVSYSSQWIRSGKFRKRVSYSRLACSHCGTTTSAPNGGKRWCSLQHASSLAPLPRTVQGHRRHSFYRRAHEKRRGLYQSMMFLWQLAVIKFKYCFVRTNSD